MEDDSIARFTGAALPEGFSGTPEVTDGRITVNATTSIAGAIDDYPVLTITYEGLAPGYSEMYTTVNGMKDYNGTVISPVIGADSAVYVSLPSLPRADFSGNPTEGIIPFHVTFTDLSSGYPSSYDWSFGDSSANSTNKDPVHTYRQAGSFTVGLNVTNLAGSNSTLKPGYIQAKQVPLWFMGNATSGTVPLHVTFNGTSSGTATNWVYYFGDGTTGSGPDTTHTYTAPGTYTVRAIADIGGVRNNIIRYNYITVS